MRPATTAFQNAEERNFLLLLRSAKWGCSHGSGLYRVAIDAMESSCTERDGFGFPSADHFWSWVDQLPLSQSQRFLLPSDETIAAMFACIAHVGCGSCFGIYLPKLSPSTAIGTSEVDLELQSENFVPEVQSCFN